MCSSRLEERTVATLAGIFFLHELITKKAVVASSHTIFEAKMVQMVDRKYGRMRTKPHYYYALKVR
jgi:hypothetical protein